MMVDIDALARLCEKVLPRNQGRAGGCGYCVTTIDSVGKSHHDLDCLGIEIVAVLNELERKNHKLRAVLGTILAGPHTIQPATVERAHRLLEGDEG